MEKINLKNSGIVELQSFGDNSDGVLTICEVGKNIPIEIKRFYYINNLNNKETVRGKHAHKKTEQYIFCVNGSFVLELDDGINKQEISLNSSNIGIRLGAMLWHNMKNFSEDCVILVVANDIYKKDDYIRDYDEFLKLL